jgi:tetratricopeptide (TPR) repeat protein
MQGVDVRGYALTQPRVPLHYVRLAAWPHPLVIDHGWPIEDSLARALPSAVVVLLALAATVSGLLRGSWLGFLGAWFFLILAPTSSFVPLGDAAAEHRMYLPLAALVALAVAGGHRLARALAARSRARPGSGDRIALAIALLAVLALGLRTRARNRDYRDEVTLWESTVRHAPGNGRGYNLLAGALAREDRLPEAIEVLRRGLAVVRERGASSSDRVHRALIVNLASTLIRCARHEEAVALLRGALEHGPGDGQMQRQLALALDGLGRHDEALAAAQRARDLVPSDLEAILLVASLGVRASDWAAAERAFREALARLPGDCDLMIGLGFSLEKQERSAEARATYGTVLSHQPENVRALFALGRCFEHEGLAERALEQYRRAAELEPDNPRMAEAIGRLRR